jgi:hypothetical protein
MFITAFTSARHLSLSWSSSIQSIPSHPTSWRFILILFFHLCLVLTSGLFTSGFPTKTLYTPQLSSIHITCPAYPILFYLITRTILGEGYGSLSSSLCRSLHSPVPSVLNFCSLHINSEYLRGVCGCTRIALYFLFKCVIYWRCQLRKWYTSITDGMMPTGESLSTRKKRVPVPLCSP